MVLRSSSLLEEPVEGTRTWVLRMSTLRQRGHSALIFSHSERQLLWYRVFAFEEHASLTISKFGLFINFASFIFFPSLSRSYFCSLFFSCIMSSKQMMQVCSFIAWSRLTSVRDTRGSLSMSSMCVCSKSWIYCSYSSSSRSKRVRIRLMLEAGRSITLLSLGSCLLKKLHWRFMLKQCKITLRRRKRATSSEK